MLRFSHFVSGAVGPRRHKFLMVYFFSHRICITCVPLCAGVGWMKDMQCHEESHEDFQKASEEAPHLKVINKTKSS